MIRSGRNFEEQPHGVWRHEHPPKQNYYALAQAQATWKRSELPDSSPLAACTSWWQLRYTDWASWRQCQQWQRNKDMQVEV